MKKKVFQRHAFKNVFLVTSFCRLKIIKRIIEQNQNERKFYFNLIMLKKQTNISTEKQNLRDSLIREMETRQETFKVYLLVERP